MTRFPCGTEHRRGAVRAAGVVNGIDYVEVRDSEEPVLALRQRTLYVRLLQPVPATLGPANVRIEGGTSVPTVAVEWAASGTETAASKRGGLSQADFDVLLAGVHEPDHVLVVRTAARGDFSHYTLRLQVAPADPSPPAGFDPMLAEVDLWFKVECASDFDCAPVDRCPPHARTSPAIDYLAKDYQAFRRLMLDRMSLLAPGWTERNPADLGTVLVELLAYVADELSYRQDAVATEAYLGTARSRVSLRRHARLVDYRVHEGCNARAWVQVRVASPAVTLPAGTPLLTRVPNLPARLDPGSRDHQEALAARPVVFETVEDALLDVDLDELRFYTWGEPDCCLPRGTTRATLRGAHPALHPGDVLVLAETRSPTNDEEADADPAKRWAVRLVDVTVGTDPAGGLFEDPPDAGPVDVTDVTWHPADALPFPLCLAVAASGFEPSRAWGNIVLADHGETEPDEPLGLATGRRYRPLLRRAPLTHAAPVPDPGAPASAALVSSPRRADPAVHVVGTRLGVAEDWRVQPDLLASDGAAPELTVESEHDGQARLRFGDGEHGRLPQEGTSFSVTYRVGNGPMGNVGAEALAHAVTTVAIVGVRNPLAAAGGARPETPDEIRRDAPQAFAVQERAVTESDYAEVTRRNEGVQQAAATFRWTGSWHTAFVTAQRPGGAEVDEEFETDLRAWLERYRLAGYDLEVDQPRYVPVEIGLLVCVSPGHLRAHVAAAVLEALSNGVGPDGRKGLFHTDNLTFAQPVFLSSVYAAVHALAGVESVVVTTFERQSEPASSGLENGVLPMGRLEIARLDNDPNFPERGVLNVTLGGGV